MYSIRAVNSQGGGCGTIKSKQLLSSMASVSVFLSDLQTGHSTATVQVGLLHFLEVCNVCCDGKLMGVDILVLDS
ncbi:unnamed protein product [Eruca vesicaria subsp. sativa]|uniref:Uncharacterized protein n=1 Tax=Eruca vesicaria subsp. sativa TaxID=29727 RepID=A0ABC8JNS8_ERUVS|nr:unnamed protein product [Eruca vesicaria subsp. sativa]